MKKLLSVIIFIFVLSFCNLSFAATDEFKAFLSQERQNNVHDVNVVGRALLTFQKLGYINVAGNDYYQIANSAQVVRNYIAETGRNYGLITVSHGDVGAIYMGDEWITASQVSGYWHLVALNSCLSMADDSFANAFHTVGYSRRASLGWYLTTNNLAMAEWWGYFYEEAGNTNLRADALAAADRCQNDTPIRIYGDKTGWNGEAW